MQQRIASRLNPWPIGSETADFAGQVISNQELKEGVRFAAFHRKLGTSWSAKRVLVETAELGDIPATPGLRFHPTLKIDIHSGNTQGYQIGLIPSISLPCIYG